MKMHLQSVDRHRSIAKLLGSVIALVVSSLVLTACGGGDGAATSTGTGASTGVGSSTSTTAASGGEATASLKAIAPFVGHPSPFPVTEMLNEVPTGATIAYAECGTSVCGLMWELLTSAAKTMGVKVTRVKTGPDARTLTTGFDSIVQLKPDAVIAIAAEVDLWERQLKELQAEGTKIVASGIANTEAFGIQAAESSNAQNYRAGELMASYVPAEMNPEADVVVYKVPELSFSGQIGEKFVETIEAQCAGCSVRTVEIPVAAMGNTSASTIVSDLQSHPETNVAAFTTATLVSGLPQALQAAGIDLETIAYAPAPTELQYIKEGKLTAGLGFDIPVSVWTLLDMTAREIIGQPLEGLEAEGYAVSQFLAQEDITFDPSKGWTGYPDFADRFAQLWGVGGGS